MSDQLPPPPEPSRTGKPRMPLLAAIGVPLAVAAVAAFLLVGAGTSDDLVLPVVPAQATAEVDPAADALGEDALTLPTVTYDTYLDRDPFEPVLREAAEVESPDTVAAPAPAPPTPTGGTIVVDPETGQLIVVSSDPSPTTQPTDPSQPDGSTDDPNTTDSRRCQGGDELVCEGRVVTLSAVEQTSNGASATFQVDTVVYTVGVGEDFATSFRLLSVDGSCATFLYGDERNTLCTGQSTLK
jgi:hypothetical protein